MHAILCRCSASATAATACAQQLCVRAAQAQMCAVGHAHPLHCSVLQLAPKLSHTQGHMLQCTHYGARQALCIASLDLKAAELECGCQTLSIDQVCTPWHLAACPS